MLDKLCWEGQTVAELQNGHSQRVLFQTIVVFLSRNVKGPVLVLSAIILALYKDAGVLILQVERFWSICTQNNSGTLPT